MKRCAISAALAALLAGVMACNLSSAASMTPPVAVSATPLPATAIVPTRDSGDASPVPPTSTVPVSTQSTPERVTFAAGATSATLQGQVGENGMATYILGAAKDQTMTVEVTATGGKVGLTIVSPGGSPLVRSALGQTRWVEKLAEDGDYTVMVVWLEGAPAVYTLAISIPPLTGGSTGCRVTNDETLTAYRESSPTADVFGTADPGTNVMALGRTKDGWLGFDPAVAQAGNVGRARLRWVLPDWSTLTFDPAGCDKQLPYLLSYASIANATYRVMELFTVTLTNGDYTDTTLTAADTGSRVQNTRIETVTFGDMNSDGAEDAVVVLITSTGGTGRFVELALMVNADGQPQHVASVSIGDRTLVHAISITDGILSADLTVHDADDGACCPSLKVTWKFVYQSGTLAKLGD